MKGDVTLWIPGTDHAGIATQTVVERMVMKEENKTRHDYGRVEFLKLVHQWKEKYGDNIKSQLRRMGSSLDWSREFFTMDKHVTDAVLEVFIRLYDAGLIYRSNRLVSWCPYLSTALSDVEVDTFEITNPTHLTIPGISPTMTVS